MARRSSGSGCALLILLAIVVSVFGKIAEALKDPIGQAVAIGGVTVVVVSVFVAKVVVPASRTRRARREYEQLMAELRELREGARRAADAALGQLCSRVTELVLQHREALRVQYRSTVYRDAYGREVLDRFVKELIYFRDNIVIPEVQPWLRAFDEARSAYVDRTVELGFAMGGADQLPPSGVSALSDYLTAAYMALPTEEGSVLPDDIVNGTDYERFCATQLRSGGWAVTERGGCGDHGVDLLAQKEDKKIALQCKFYDSPVGNDAVQEAYTGAKIVGVQFAAVVSHSGYTPAARVAAERTGVLLLATENLATLVL